MPAKLDLDEWRIVLDREDSGLDESWFATAFSETETVKPPGSLQAQGFGDDSGINTPWTGDIPTGGMDKAHIRSVSHRRQIQDAVLVATGEM